MEWKRFKDELPPIGKRVIATRPGSDEVGIATMFYTFIHEEDKRNSLGLGATEESIKEMDGYWLEFPEPPVY